MKFRSWYLVLLGILFQSVVAFLFLTAPEDSDILGGLVATTLAIVIFAIGIGLGALPLLLLLFGKTRKVGAIISIVLGVIGIVTQVGMFVGIFLVVAGFVSLWRKC